MFHALKVVVLASDNGLLIAIHIIDIDEAVGCDQLVNEAVA
jgi:hypothetical protein